MWPEIVSRDRELRWVRVLRFRLASLGPLMSSVAEELKDSKAMERSTCRCGPLGVDSRLVGRTIKTWSNVDARPFPANGSRIYMPTGCPVGLKLIGDRERTWRAMPCIACEDPSYEGAM